MRSSALPVFLWLVFAIVARGAPLRPFPQHSTYAQGTIHPQVAQSEMDAATAAFYDAWKARYFHEGCEPGQAYIFYNREKTAPDRNAISVSEGHGYGMLIAAYFAGHDPEAQACFDQLFAFFRAHQSHLTPNLMAWQQLENCREKKGDEDSATDGDLDIAYSLLLADRQWGSAGKINYREEALKVIAAIKAGDVNAVVPILKEGDWVKADSAQANDTRLSDFMPDHFHAFSKVTGDAIWTKLADKEFTIVDFLQKSAAPKSGLLPDFARKLDGPAPAPAGKQYLESAYDGDYYYNSCRCPWRIGLDYLLHGDARAKAIAEKLNAFIEQTTKGNPDAIRAGYRLSGKVINHDDTSLAFTAPFAVAAMADGAHQKWLDQLWKKIVETPADDDDYYGNTLKLLCLTVISGNWWEP